MDSRIGNRPVVRSVMEKTSGEREYYLAMPYIFREDVEKVFEEEYGESLEAFDGVLIRNLERPYVASEKRLYKTCPGGL